MIYVEFIFMLGKFVYTRVPFVGLVSISICSWDLNKKKTQLKFERLKRGLLKIDKATCVRLCHRIEMRLLLCVQGYLWSCGKELIFTAAFAAVLYSLRPLMPISRKTAYSENDENKWNE